MPLPFKLSSSMALQGTAGVYALHAEGNGNQLFVNTAIAPGLGRHGGQTYNAYSLMLRMLFCGDDPKEVPGLELRDKKPYKMVGDENGDDVYAQQLNKLLFPVATTNIGSEGLVAQLAFHFEALGDMLTPFMETNGLKVVQGLPDIFEAQNPAFYVPPVMFAPPKELKSWDDTVSELKAAAKAQYEPKNPNYKAQGGDAPAV